MTAQRSPPEFDARSDPTRLDRTNPAVAIPSGATRAGCGRGGVPPAGEGPEGGNEQLAGVRVVDRALGDGDDGDAEPAHTDLLATQL